MAGRPPSRLAHVDRLHGPETRKHRLRVILQTLTDAGSVAAACRELGVSESRFHDLRRQALQGALDGLAPRPSGRPRKEVAVEPERVQALEHQVQELEVDLEAQRIRAELALVMPHLVKKNAGVRQTRPRRNRRKRKR
jgi:transposase-like protein